MLSSLRRCEFAYAGRPRFDGGSGDKDKKIDVNDPAVKAAITSAVETQVAGLKKNRDEILAEKGKLEDELKTLRETWGDLDPKQVTSLLKRLENDEEAKLIADGKIDEVVGRRTEALRKDLEARVTAALTRIDELEGHVQSKDGQIAELVIDAEIRGAAAKIDEFQPTAVEDAVLLARGVFQIDETGKPVIKSSEGVVQLGKDAKSPLAPAEWLESQMGARPHWRLPSAGGGANGSGDAKAGDPGDVSKLERMSPRDKLAVGLRNQAEA